jgi:hypothetical protein
MKSGTQSVMVVKPVNGALVGVGETSRVGDGVLSTMTGSETVGVAVDVDIILRSQPTSNRKASVTIMHHPILIFITSLS